MTKKRSKDQYIFQVKEENELLPFLLQRLDQGRNRTKSMLARGQVLVGERVETQFNCKLVPGETITILKHAVPNHKNKGIEILYEDDEVIVINKDAGLLTIASSKEKQRTAYHQLTEHVRMQHPKNRIFIVHRLDRDTSGVMVFARTEKVKRSLQDHWKQVVKKRTYVAVVEGHISNQQQKLVSWLKETKTHKMYASAKDNGGQKAITHMKKLDANKKYTLLELELDTGRKNQIRVQMEQMKTPIVGDKKYGATTNPIGRLALHANVLVFRHPITNTTLEFKVEVPNTFFELTKG
ncbi:Ribosomal large subunit pseudouridine synthase D [Paraliobacillus sp. PM-2]|uniref:RluA family pseudouridine synthase n=1 Tax=Paraliobacillus sp. PM-2 TaxID=1462524 RepID=UPI00061B8BBA|nr:RluA family pseudouridine synthase [Paraliobacillus sp. PM-2]CQR47975.1 Ribosomal large subunit pseudouridine synthase D [Paraliobacillus sp. PM-2]